MQTLFLMYTTDSTDADRWNEVAAFMAISTFLVVEDTQSWFRERADVVHSAGISLSGENDEDERGELVLHRTGEAWECILVLPSATERLAEGNISHCLSHFCNIAVQPGPHWFELRSIEPPDATTRSRPIT